MFLKKYIRNYLCIIHCIKLINYLTFKTKIMKNPKIKFIDVLKLQIFVILALWWLINMG